jgi:hypothetical protein
MWVLLCALAWADDDELDLEQAAPPERIVAPPPEPERSVMLGARVGVVMPRSAMTPGPALSLEAGLQPASLAGRVQPLVLVTVGRTQASGSVDDPSFASELDWQLTQAWGGAGVGVRLRALSTVVPVSPTLTLAPQLSWSMTTTGAGEPNARESAFGVGAVGELGLAVRAGPGRVDLALGARWMPQRGALTGDASALNLLPMVGYRMAL